MQKLERLGFSKTKLGDKFTTIHFMIYDLMTNSSILVAQNVTFQNINDSTIFQKDGQEYYRDHLLQNLCKLWLQL